MNHKKIVLHILLLSIIALSFVGCGQSQYVFQIFTFPTDADSMSNQWEYKLTVTVFGPSRKKMESNSLKQIEIVIIDTENNVLFFEKIQKEVRFIFSHVFWNNANDLELILIEADSVSEEFIDPQMRQEMIESGNFSEVTRIKFHYDLKTKKFLRNFEN